MEKPFVDLVTLEPPPISQTGVSALYTREFYTLAQDRLTEGGWLTQWLPAYQLPEARVLSLVRAFVDVFPDAVLLVGQGRELVLVGRRGGPPVLDVDAVAQRLGSRTEVADDLDAIGIPDVRALVATFATDGPALRAATLSSPPLTDDWPIAEASQVSHIADNLMPRVLFQPERFGAFAPALTNDPDAIESAADRAVFWQTEDFLRYHTLPSP